MNTGTLTISNSNHTLPLPYPVPLPPWEKLIGIEPGENRPPPPPPMCALRLCAGVVFFFCCCVCWVRAACGRLDGLPTANDGTLYYCGASEIPRQRLRRLNRNRRQYPIHPAERGNKSSSPKTGRTRLTTTGPNLGRNSRQSQQILFAPIWAMSRRLPCG